METFIRRIDYNNQIRNDVLDVIIDQDESILQSAENAAIAELVSYLSQRYKTDEIFAVIHVWSKSKSWTSGDRVSLTPSVVWNNTSTFTDGTYLADAGSENVYRVKNSPVAGTLVTNSGYFDLIGDFGALYYAKEDMTSGFEIGDASKWTAGDTRDPLILRFLIDVILYEIHCRINPRNIPQHRINRRDDAIDWLKKVADPRNNVNPNFPEKTFDENKGLDIVFGSNKKQSHYY